MSERMDEPTSDDCNARAVVRVRIGGTVYEGRAAWYPQMGGYCGKSLIVASPTNGGTSSCFDVAVWHDSEFPFDGSERLPCWIHHCDGGQFIDFGQLLLDMEREVVAASSPT